MNERIKELEERCWEELGEEECYYTVFNTEKFAELIVREIVRECIDVCANGWQGEFTAAGISQCVSDLKEHFGVEE